MKSKQSFLDNLNAGRLRRSDTAHDEITRTLDKLDERLADTLVPDDSDQAESRTEFDIAKRIEDLSHEVSARYARMQAKPGAASAQSLPDAHNSAGSQKTSHGRSEGIAADLRSLQEDVRRAGGGNLRQELDAMRELLARIGGTALQSTTTVGLSDELARLSRVVTQLAERKGSKNPDTRDQEDRLASQPHEALEGLSARVEEIGAAVARLPQSLSLDALDERLHALAASLDELVGRDQAGEPDLYTMIEERLDEITRAITASAALASKPGFDISVLERIEARISSLANQIDELIEDRSDAVIVERLDVMSERVDNLATRIGLPAQAVEQLAAHIALLASKLEATSLHERGDDPTAGLIEAMDSRFAELAARFDETRGEGGDNAAIHALGERLDEIVRQLQISGDVREGEHSDSLHSLEQQVAELASKLTLPATDNYAELAPRLESIERSIADNHSAVMEAARRAAEEAVGALNVTQGGQLDEELRQELQTLEALTRKSDERNTRTFGAIHDTLLKIVDRLGELEAGSTSGKITVDNAPPIDAGDTHETEEDVRQTPAEAAAAAAEAALKDDGDIGSAAAESALLADAKLGASEEDTQDGFLDPERMNEPLEPGSGAPDLNAVMRRVRDSSKVSETSEDAAKADFIAAARRAARAAAAEADVFQTADAESSAKRGKSGLVRRSKQALLAAGAVIFLGGALYYGSSFIAPDNDSSRLTKSAEDGEAEHQSAAGDGTDLQEPVAPAASETASTDAQDGTNDDIQTASVDKSEGASGNASDPGPVASQLPRTGNDAAPKAHMEPQEQTGSPVQEQAESASEPAEPEIPEVPNELEPAALREAASGGDPVALYEIGRRYETGQELDADMSEAARWYEAAAAKGIPTAQFRIGNLYEKGIGVTRDVVKAKMWYERAAEQGNASAMHNLGVLLAMGVGGEVDNEEAARWFLEAAELGMADSQYNLGILAAKGMGMQRDLVEAYKWFDIASRSGDEDAAAKRDEVAEIMAPADLVKARGKSELWKARQPDPKANTVDVPSDWKTDDIMTGSVDMTKAIENIQLILNKNGYDAGPADGVLGERTRAAIQAFQKENGMAATGSVDDTLVQALLELNEAKE